MTFDSTIHLSDLVLVGAGILAFFKAFLWQRDINRDVLRLLKGEDGKNGLVLSNKELRKDMYEDAGAVSRIRSSIQILKVAMATRGIQVRDEDQP